MTPKPVSKIMAERTANAVRALNEKLERYKAACEAAIAYDAAIQRFETGKNWIVDDKLDELYANWITLSRKALGIELPIQGEDPP